MSSILYSKSCFNGDLRPIEELYNWGIKQLLGDRINTCTDVFYVELGSPPLKSIILAKKRKLFQRRWQERGNMSDDPWEHAVRLTTIFNTPMNIHINNMINNFVDKVAVGIVS